AAGAEATAAAGADGLRGNAAAPVGVHSRAAALRLIGAAEDASEHPIARAIADAARSADGARLPGLERFANREGLGVEAVVEGVGPVVVGRPSLLAEHGLELPAPLDAARAAAEAKGRTAVVA